MDGNSDVPIEMNLPGEDTGAGQCLPGRLVPRTYGPNELGVVKERKDGRASREDGT